MWSYRTQSGNWHVSLLLFENPCLCNATNRKVYMPKEWQNGLVTEPFLIWWHCDVDPLIQGLTETGFLIKMWQMTLSHICLTFMLSKSDRWLSFKMWRATFSSNLGTHVDLWIWKKPPWIFFRTNAVDHPKNEKLLLRS